MLRLRFAITRVLGTNGGTFMLCTQRALLSLCLSASVATPAFAACVDYSQFVHVLGGVMTPDYAEDVAVKNDYVYVAASTAIGTSGLRVVNITDPTKPRVIGSINTLSLRAVALDGTNLYVLDDNTGFRVIDVSNPAAPVLGGGLQIQMNGVGDIATTPGLAYVVNKFEFRVFPVSASGVVSEPQVLDTPGYAVALALYDHWAFVADDHAGLTVIDIANPTSPTLVQVVDTPGYAQGVAVTPDGKTAFVADGATVRIMDVTNPATAVEVGHFTPEYAAQDVVVAGNLLYVASGYSRVIAIYDITDRNSPVELGEAATRFGVRSLVVDGPIACVANWEAGICILDITNPEPPAVAATLATPGIANDIEVGGAYAYMAAGTWGLNVVNIADPTAPFLVGSHNTPAEALRVEVNGSHLYVADKEGDLQIYSVANPAAPAFVRSFSKVGWCYDVAVSGNRAYLVDGFTIVDVSDPANPVERGSVTTLFQSRAVEVVGNYAYVIDREQDLVVINVANPDAPYVVTTRSIPGLAQDIQISGNYAYVNDYNYQVHLFDLSNPAAPVLASKIVSAYSQPTGVAAADGVVYIGGASSGLYVYDASDPALPYLLGAVYPPEYANSIEVAGGYVYMADGDEGLVVAYAQCENPADGPPAGDVTAGALTLLPAWPNPTRGDVMLHYVVPNASGVRLEVFNVAGNRVRRLLEQPVRAGRWTMAWDGRDDSGRRLAAGSYIVRLTSSQGRSATRVTLLR